METKVCTKCKEEKEISLFRKTNKVNKKGEEYVYVHTICKKCINKSKHKSERKNKEKYNEKARIKMKRTRLRIKEDPERSKKYKLTRRKWRIKKTYNISIEKFDEISKNQNNKCIICDTPVELLVIDHCHNSNKVRGLLCDQCNLGLGAFKDNIEILEKAIQYLQNPPLIDQDLI